MSVLTETSQQKAANQTQVAQLTLQNQQLLLQLDEVKTSNAEYGELVLRCTCGAGAGAI